MSTATATPPSIDFFADYCRSRSEADFTRLVCHYLPLVYSAALRKVRDPGMAEDVTQAAFILLVRKAPRLAAHTSLGGWLLKTTHYCARDALKRAHRRAHHEQKAAAMRSETDPTTDRLWPDLTAKLDAALAALSEKDRSALALRFFEGKTLEEVGGSLGLSKDAANKRVSRALERLRLRLSGHAAPIPAAALSTLICSYSTAAVPAHLASSVPAAAFHSGLSAVTPGSLIAKGVLRMASLKFKVAAFAALMLLAGGIFFVKTNAQSAPPASGPAVSDGANTLAPDVGVEILGVAQVEGQSGVSPTWWGPDGTPLAVAPEISRNPWHRENTPDQANYRIAVRTLSGKIPNRILAGIPLQDWGQLGVSADSRQQLVGFSLPKDATTATLRVEFMVGPPQTALVSDGKAPAHATTDSGDFAISQALEDNGRLAFALACRSPSPSSMVQVTDLDGQVHNFLPGSGLNNKFSEHPLLYTGIFYYDVRKERLRSIQWDVRYYDQWIEIRNISLRPDVKTKLEIVSGITDIKVKPDAAATKPVVIGAGAVR